MPIHEYLLLLFAASVTAGSLTDIKHVVLFMQENRAFDHYFGTMPGTYSLFWSSIDCPDVGVGIGVRGFADPNVQVNPDGRTVWQQLVSNNMSEKAEHLTPWYLNYLGGDWLEATQCMVAGSNAWTATVSSESMMST